MSSAHQNPVRIGVFGGTFDPIHRAHVRIGRAARDQFGLDRVLFVVARIPPHKQNHTDTDAEDRFAMVEAVLQDQPGLEASRVELDRDGVSYTADTLRSIRLANPGAELFLIIGMDSLIDLPRWKEPEAILEEAHLLVVPRPGQWTAPPELEGRFLTLDLEPIDLSSTEIRARIESGAPLDDLLPAPVARMIQEKGLYGSVARHSAG